MGPTAASTPQVVERLLARVPRGREGAGVPSRRADQALVE
jgi:hypothetical protein